MAGSRAVQEKLSRNRTSQYSQFVKKIGSRRIQVWIAITIPIYSNLFHILAFESWTQVFLLGLNISNKTPLVDHHFLHSNLGKLGGKKHTFSDNLRMVMFRPRKIGGVKA